MQELFQKILLKIFKNGSKVLDFFIIFLSLTTIILSLHIYFYTKRGYVNVYKKTNKEMFTNSDKLYKTLLYTIDNPLKDGEFFSFPTGKYYFPKSCQTIKTKPKQQLVWFKNELQAISSGLIKSSNCK